MKEFFSKLNTALKDIFFPLRYTCSACDKEIFDDEQFCDECEKSVRLITENKCQKCGRETLYAKGECSSCSHETAVDLSRSVFSYEGAIKSVIHKLKYSSARYLADMLAPYLKNVYIENFFAPDIITFVPMSIKAEEKRGYNQSELLADALAKLLSAEAYCTLEKVKDTARQAELDFEERSKNLKGAFKVTDKKFVKGKHVLIVDDVLTTGATSHEVASALKTAGAKSVYLLTVASVSREKKAKKEENEEENEEIR